MKDKTEKYLKDNAFSIFLKLVSAKNKSLAITLKRNRGKVYRTVIRHIQRVGIHQYAALVLERKSDYRDELDTIIRGDDETFF